MFREFLENLCEILELFPGLSQEMFRPNLGIYLSGPFLT